MQADALIEPRTVPILPCLEAAPCWYLHCINDCGASVGGEELAQAEEDQVGGDEEYESNEDEQELAAIRQWFDFYDGIYSYAFG